MTARIRRLTATVWLGFAVQALGDGGTVQMSKVSGPYRVTILTSPTPLRVGAMDVSVVVGDAAGDRDIQEARIVVSLAPAGQPADQIDRPATTNESPSKLFQMAAFDIPQAGMWTLVATIDGPLGRTRVETEVEVGPQLPRWVDLLAWIILPAGPIAIYIAGERRRGVRAISGR